MFVRTALLTVLLVRLDGRPPRREGDGGDGGFMRGDDRDARPRRQRRSRPRDPSRNLTANIVLAVGTASALAYFVFPQMSGAARAAAALVTAGLATASYLGAEALQRHQRREEARYAPNER